MNSVFEGSAFCNVMGIHSEAHLLQSAAATTVRFTNGKDTPKVNDRFGPAPMDALSRCHSGSKKLQLQVPPEPVSYNEATGDLSPKATLGPSIVLFFFSKTSRRITPRSLQKERSGLSMRSFDWERRKRALKVPKPEADIETVKRYALFLILFQGHHNERQMMFEAPACCWSCQAFRHCNLKPENILVGSGMRVKISDFGLAEDSSVQTGDWNSQVSSIGGPGGQESVTMSSINRLLTISSVLAMDKSRLFLIVNTMTTSDF
ncbi:MAG: hypothetical protein JOS17DRAFT_791019 [Linnemannia elongata]|nr:MAG: hypothetical protein JOS17DRAFT_791019 [Linnemannia elongata]